MPMGASKRIIWFLIVIDSEEVIVLYIYIITKAKS